MPLSQHLIAPNSTSFPSAEWLAVWKFRIRGVPTHMSSHCTDQIIELRDVLSSTQMSTKTEREGPSASGEIKYVDNSKALRLN